MMDNYSLLKTGILFVFIILIGTFPIYGQINIPERNLSENEKAQLFQSERLNQEANVFFREAESIYDQMENLKTKPEFSDSAKKISQLRNDLLETAIAGLRIAGDSDSLLYDIYRNHQGELQKQKPSDTQNVKEAESEFEEAEILFNEAGRLRKRSVSENLSSEKVFILLEAAFKLEQLSFRKLNEALSTFYPEDNREVYFSEKLPDKYVVVDKSLLTMITKALNEYDEEDALYSDLSNVRLKDTVSFGKVKKLLDGNVGDYIADKVEKNVENEAQEEQIFQGDTLNKLFRNIRYGIEMQGKKGLVSENDSERLLNKKEKVIEILKSGWHKYYVEDFSTLYTAEEYKKNNEITRALNQPVDEEQQAVPHQDSLTEQNTEVPGLSEEQPESEGKDLPDERSENMIFKVQIAATKSPIPGQALKELYKGPEKINLDTISGWYKYSIGSFDSFEEANELRNQTDVPGAFVAVYRKSEDKGLKPVSYKVDGEKPGSNIAEQEPDSSLNYQNETSADSTHSDEREFGASTDSILFQVQIAASDEQLSMKELESIYAGDKPITEFKEEGFYKYAIGNFYNYEKALSLKKRIDVSGAFVVAFDKYGKPTEIPAEIKERK